MRRQSSNDLNKVVTEGLCVSKPSQSKIRLHYSKLPNSLIKNKSILQDVAVVANHVTLTRPRSPRLSLTAHAYMLLIQASSARSSNEPRLEQSPQFSPRLSQTRLSHRSLRDANGSTLHVDLQSTFLNRIINSFTTCQADSRCALFVRNTVVSLQLEEWD